MLDSSDERPPIAGLFHEFANVYDYDNNSSANGPQYLFCSEPHELPG